jgi:dihydroorotate dehydrogenase electron transfer subunit
LTAKATTTCRSLHAETASLRYLSRDLLVVELLLPEPLDFQPGQFAMLNFPGQQELVFSRPFSILAVEECRVSFYYRVVGRGTALLAALRPGDPVSFLGPLGHPFPAPDSEQPVLLLAGGVGLPPLLAWWQRYRRSQDQAFFGARDGHDVPWDLLDPTWQISVDRREGLPPGRQAEVGLVTEVCQRWLADQQPEPTVYLVQACGPLPMLRAAFALATSRQWSCLVSVEEHMGCGYGVCRGCVVPERDGGHLTACQDGPVLDASTVDWDAFGRGSV